MTNQLASINHIVVLALENRSFDQMLGFLYTDQNNSVAGGSKVNSPQILLRRSRKLLNEAHRNGQFDALIETHHNPIFRTVKRN